MNNTDYILEVYERMKELIAYSETVDIDKIDIVFDEAYSYVFYSDISRSVEMIIKESRPEYDFIYSNPSNDKQADFKCFFYALQRYIKVRDYLSVNDQIKNKVKEIFLPITG